MIEELERLRRDNTLLAAIIDRNKRAHRLELARLRQSLIGADEYALEQREQVEEFNRFIATVEADEEAFGEKVRGEVRERLNYLMRDRNFRYRQPSKALLRDIRRAFHLPEK